MRANDKRKDNEKEHRGKRDRKQGRRTEMWREERDEEKKKKDQRNSG
jgi:hypothetical protein